MDEKTEGGTRGATTDVMRLDSTVGKAWDLGRGREGEGERHVEACWSAASFDLSRFLVGVLNVTGSGLLGVGGDLAVSHTSHFKPAPVLINVQVWHVHVVVVTGAA